MTEGVAWPNPSTTGTAKAVWMAAAKEVDAKLPDAINAEKNWRHNYPKYLLDLADLQAKSAESTLRVARAGLKAVLDEFVFERNGTKYPLHPCDAIPRKGKLHTAVVNGTGGTPHPPSMALNGRLLEGAELVKKVQGWVNYGSAEQSVVASLKAIVDLPAGELSQKLSDKVFVLLGATSAAGPAIPLLRLGATVCAVARKGAKLSGLVNEAAKSPGKLLVPVPEPTTDLQTIKDSAGADVLTASPEIIDWLKDVAPGKTLVIGSYIYLDGKDHVSASVAMDLIATAVSSARPCALAYLGSPSTAHSISMEAHSASEAAYSSPGLGVLNPFRWCMFRKNARPPVKSAEGVPVPVTNGMAVMQGPNYALAKTMQFWRALVARADGQVVSANLAPAMYTESMLHIPAIVHGLNGYQSMRPLAAYDPDTVRAIMAYLMLHDLFDPSSYANPATRFPPSQLYCENAFHGGSWRCAYESESVSKYLYMMGKMWYGRPAEPPSA